VLRCSPAGFEVGSDRGERDGWFDEPAVHFIHIKSCVGRQALVHAAADAGTLRGTESSHDSPLEGARFEPSVPRQKDNVFRDAPVQLAMAATAERSHAATVS